MDFDDELIARTMAAIDGVRALAQEDKPPEPLIDSPKCPRCSLIGICLPDEIGFLTEKRRDIRPIYAQATDARPLYVQSPACYLRKEGERLIIEEDRETIADVRLLDTSQVALFGHCGISSPALHECFRREIPVTFMSYGGWFVGHAVGVGHRNAQTRAAQYKASFDEAACLRLARGFIAAKIQNCRTLLRRNWKDGEIPASLLADLQSDKRHVARAASLAQLLGVEGSAARRYFSVFAAMLAPDKRVVGAVAAGFDFTGRNRRPPKDPVNAMLSFAYAMLTREWTVTLSAVGLDPYRGFYHQMRFARPALALDMMEAFRPLVADSAVLTAINNGEVKVEDFLVTATGCALKAPGRKRFIAVFERRLEQEITHPIFQYRLSYRRLFEVQARLLIRALTGEISEYPDFVTR